LILQCKFSTVNDAYIGVTITVDFWTSAGDIRKVTAYNPTTKTLTVDTPFTITLDTTSTVTLRFAVKDVESIMKINSSTFKIVANANISVQSKE
jgi:tripartite-type tricarboxylate transporter receptor subunit TctC